MKQPRLQWERLALVAAIALVTACGDDDAESATDGAPAATTSAEPAGEPLKLMTVFEGTGIASASPEIPEGAIAAADAINRSGGIQGRPVEIVVCDTKNDPNKAAECGRRAVSEGVLAMVGNLTLYSGEFMPLIAENKIASIGLEPATASDFSSPAAFPIAGGAPVVWAGLAGSLAESGAEKIALARIDVGPAAALSDFANAGLARFDMTVSKDVPIPPGAPDMSTYVAAALEGGADALVVGLPAQDAVNFVLALRQTSPDMEVALSATELGEVLDALGENAEGLVQIASLTTALKNTAEQRYEEHMAAAGYEELGGFRLAAYASVLVFQQIAQALPEITPAAVFDALAQAENLDVGLTAPLQFTTSVEGLPRVFNTCVFASRITGADGEQEPITGKFQDVYTGAECSTPA
jgi:ABC-type branched-subunit amino acid transport system substrate-binding protein